MGIYKNYLALVIKKLTPYRGGFSKESIKDEAIILIQEYITELECQWANGQIAEDNAKLLDSITKDKDYWNDWEYTKETKKEEEKNMNYNEGFKKIEEKARTTGTSTYTYTGYYSAPVGFSYHGRKNETILPDFVNLCKMSQKKLKQYLVKQLKEYYNKDKIFARDGFVFAEGNIPVMVTAHMDTVHTQSIKDYYEWTEKQSDTIKELEYDIHVLSSPQGIGGDDRCGIWMILQILKFGYRPFIIFNEDEENGCVGAKKFCQAVNNDLLDKCKEVKFIIELDRKGKHDLVFYDCDNEDFTDWCEEVTGWKEAYGSCSDISYLAPEIGCAAVNLSCGYYDEHKTWHIVKIEEMFNTLSTAIKMIEASETVERFEYVEAYGYGYGYGYTQNSYSYKNAYRQDNEYNRYYNNYNYNYQSAYNGDCIIEFEYIVYSHNSDDYMTETTKETGATFDECYKNFFKKHPYTCWNDVIDTTEYYL